MAYNGLKASSCGPLKFTMALLTTCGVIWAPNCYYRNLFITCGANRANVCVIFIVIVLLNSIGKHVQKLTTPAYNMAC